MLQVKSLDDIIPLNDSLVKPILYTHVSGFDKLPVAKAKLKFISTILPSILVAKYEIGQDQKKTKRLRVKKIWSKADSSWFDEMKIRFKAKDTDDLIMRMETLPASIVLAQAAMESGWGKSRIFLRANNLFGIWSYNKNEPRIAALIKRNNTRIYLKSYADISRSIINYFEVIGKARAYRNLREARQQTNDPMMLLPHLKNYSERKTKYTKQLRTLILKNDLTRYDHYQIDPVYLIED